MGGGGSLLMTPSAVGVGGSAFGAGSGSAGADLAVTSSSSTPALDPANSLRGQPVEMAPPPPVSGHSTRQGRHTTYKTGGAGRGGAGAGAGDGVAAAGPASGMQRRHPPHHHHHHSSATPTVTSAGTVNFPNSVSSNNKFPVSNSVAELPPLQTLPPGQAPAYEQLINFQRAKSKDSVRCVMCGKGPSDGEAGTVIPQQNKDVCRDCDKALWVHGDTRTYFKWCKGCKRFRNIVAFSEKLDASKCNGCRERGRRSYLQRKGLPGGDEVESQVAAEQQVSFDASGAAAATAAAAAHRLHQSQQQQQQQQQEQFGGDAGLTFNMSGLDD